GIGTGGIGTSCLAAGGMRRRAAIRLAALAAAGTLCGRSVPAWAASGGGDGTRRIVSVIVPDFPSGAAGTAGWLLRAPLARALGRPVVLDFRPGAGGIVGLMAGAHAAADGSVLTLLTPAIAAAPWLTGWMDSAPGDFALIGRISFMPEVVLVDAGSPWHRLDDLLAALRAAPRRVPIRFDGTWSNAEIAQAMMLDRAGLVARPVAGLRAGSALRDGDIAFAVQPLARALEGVRAGDVRALAVSAAKRVAALPGVPTLRERGIDVAVGAWLALGAPAATSAAHLVSARAALRAVLHDSTIREALAAARLPPAWQDPLQTRRDIMAEYRALGPVFTAAGVNVRQQAVAAR
ncbi:MAG: hypothetical protein KGL52_17275, partial [Rhodospirillales bacterium]|nr:hypothetical protein [Rhodospirillales bacterium]